MRHRNACPDAGRCALCRDGRSATHIHEASGPSDAYASALSPATHDSACGRMEPMNYLRFWARSRMFAQENGVIETDNKRPLFFSPFAEWRPQCLFKTGFLIKSKRSRLGWKLHINCERSLNRILSNTILISTYSLALFSWCHIGVKGWRVFFCLCMRLCVCVLPPTGEWDSVNGSQSLATINHLMYFFNFFLHYPPWAYFLFLYPTLVSFFSKKNTYRRGYVWVRRAIY